MRKTTMMVAASMALMARPIERVLVNDAALPEMIPEKPTNLPGESNRAFAARMRTTTKDDAS